MPFYLYDSPAYDWLGNCSREWSKELDARRRAMHGGEVLFVDQIARSTERMAEADAAQAQVYVVPALLVFGARCTIWLAKKSWKHKLTCIHSVNVLPQRQRSCAK